MGSDHAWRCKSVAFDGTLQQNGRDDTRASLCSPPPMDQEPSESPPLRRRRAVPQLRGRTSPVAGPRVDESVSIPTVPVPRVRYMVQKYEVVEAAWGWRTVRPGPMIDADATEGGAVLPVLPAPVRAHVPRPRMRSVSRSLLEEEETRGAGVGAQQTMGQHLGPRPSTMGFGYGLQR